VGHLQSTSVKLLLEIPQLAILGEDPQNIVSRMLMMHVFNNVRVIQRREKVELVFHGLLVLLSVSQTPLGVKDYFFLSHNLKSAVSKSHENSRSVVYSTVHTILHHLQLTLDTIPNAPLPSSPCLTLNS
jgi:hypothetical protein